MTGPDYQRAYEADAELAAVKHWRTNFRTAIKHGECSPARPASATFEAERVRRVVNWPGSQAPGRESLLSLWLGIIALHKHEVPALIATMAGMIALFAGVWLITPGN